MRFKDIWHSFPFPRQHGALVMLLIPVLTSALVADRLSWSSGLLILSFGLIFLSHHPAVSFLRRWIFRHTLDGPAFFWASVLLSSGALLAGYLFIKQQLWGALVWGMVAGSAYLLHLRFTLNKEHLSIPGEILGVFGLTAAAPALYLFQQGVVDARGLVLWMLNFLYFTGSIFYVKLKLRIQPRQTEPGIKDKIKIGLPALTYSTLILIYIMSITLWRGYSWFFLGAYIPFFIKVIAGVFIWQAKSSLNPRRFGFLELGHALIFAFFVVVGFWQA